LRKAALEIVYGLLISSGAYTAALNIDTEFLKVSVGECAHFFMSIHLVSFRYGFCGSSINSARTSFFFDNFSSRFDTFFASFRVLPSGFLRNASAPFSKNSFCHR
jgi:hypothetical protein